MCCLLTLRAYDMLSFSIFFSMFFDLFHSARTLIPSSSTGSLSTLRGEQKRHSLEPSVLSFAAASNSTVQQAAVQPNVSPPGSSSGKPASVYPVPDGLLAPSSPGITRTMMRRCSWTFRGGNVADLRALKLAGEALLRLRFEQGFFPVIADPQLNVSVRQLALYSPIYPCKDAAAVQLALFHWRTDCVRSATLLQVCLPLASFCVCFVFTVYSCGRYWVI